jgi:hypothetical protein
VYVSIYLVDRHILYLNVNAKAVRSFKLEYNRNGGFGPEENIQLLENIYVSHECRRRRRRWRRPPRTVCFAMH